LLALTKRLSEELNQGKLASQLDYTKEEKAILPRLQLLTQKPMLFVVNLHENEIINFDENKVRAELGIHPSHKIIPISAKIEQELGQLSEEETQEFLKELGLKEPGLNALIRHAYDLLGLHTYFTAGQKEVRAWTIPKGTLAPEAAGVIHTDFEKGFIRAEVIAYQKYIEHGGELGAKEKGHLRLEGKEYLVQDGDVMHFRFAN
ncbi:MAG: GTP-dependent nucleic acid-binding protein EngD, partial [Candidatus Peregrinibacteria bacterium GW2011_GWE2_39_6]